LVFGKRTTRKRSVDNSKNRREKKGNARGGKGGMPTQKQEEIPIRVLKRDRASKRGETGRGTILERLRESFFFIVTEEGKKGLGFRTERKKT